MVPQFPTPNPTTHFLSDLFSAACELTYCGVCDFSWEEFGILNAEKVHFTFSRKRIPPVNVF